MDTEITFQDKEQGLQESKIILLTSALTSWITTCTVWSNNLSHKSFFLLISSTTSILCHIFSLISIYIFNSLDLISFGSFAPITHCLLKQGNYSQNILVKNISERTLFNLINLINICNTNEPCQPFQRLCSESENPADLFNHIVLPIGLLLLFISLLASACLQMLGNYYKLYQWSKSVFVAVQLSMQVSYRIQ